jgi:hypothetical protein
MPRPPKHVTCLPRLTVKNLDQTDLLLQRAAHPLDAFVALAAETGALRLAAEARRLRLDDAATDNRPHVPQQRGLCRRLAYHLSQLQRALGRSDDECNGSINAISIVRVLVEIAIDERAHRSDDDRDELEAWLCRERTKFLMATKADAVVALRGRLTRMTRGRHELRRAGAAAVHETVGELLGGFRSRLRSETEKRLAMIAKRLLSDVEHSLGDLGEALPLDTVAGLPLTIRAFTGPMQADPRRSVLTSVADRMGVSNRHRIERAASDALVDGIERGTRRIVACVLRDYDDVRATLEHQLCEVIDGCLESANCAAQFSAHARVPDSDGVAGARCRVDDWFMALATLSARLR